MVFPALKGLSPRGRGKRRKAPDRLPTPGSIPAWAGETIAAAPPSRAARVYPRVGGGNAVLPPGTYCRQGLSPRGRGKPLGYPAADGSGRSIPAWAGETRRNRSRSPELTVYPRVGGGNIIRPRPCRLASGLSPRGRGKRRVLIRRRPHRRSIPAWAGETLLRGRQCGAPPVYPRVGGGNPGRPGKPAHPSGLSPRGRGKQFDELEWTYWIRSIPAWAGETPK